jgi:dUTP pyrophosphatase
MTKVIVKLIKTESGSDLPTPKYATEGSAGMDLYADVHEPLVLDAGKRLIVPTGISIELPPNYEAQIRPRSGLAAKNGVTVLNTPGTIDSDYRGEIKVILANFSDEDFVIERGMRIAQMIIAQVTMATLVEAELLIETERGVGGFGSTGMSV